MTRLAAILLLVAACDTPSPALRLRLTEGATQSCEAVDCADVPLTCKTWMSIRIVDPADPSAPFLSQCQEVPLNRNRNLCSIATVDLEPKELPVRDLEIQVALYPESMITTDPITLADVCPADAQYDAVHGFPVESAGSPAIGGRAYYRPGDETVTVTLGCTNLELVNDPTCVGLATVSVKATVDDFDLAASVTPLEADRLSVTVGEPSPSAGSYALNPGDVKALERTAVAPPAWATADQLFTSFACLAVLEDLPGSTTSLTCKEARVTDDELDFKGIRLTTTSLDQILIGLSLTQVPAAGMTIGIVLDSHGDPVPNQVVTAPGGTIMYLASDRRSVVGAATSGGPKGAVFVSLDAPFGTTFGTSGGMPNEMLSALGGRVSNKVTIVVLQFAGPIIEEP